MAQSKIPSHPEFEPLSANTSGRHRIGKSALLVWSWCEWATFKNGEAVLNNGWSNSHETYCCCPKRNLTAGGGSEPVHILSLHTFRQRAAYSNPHISIANWEHLRKKNGNREQGRESKANWMQTLAVFNRQETNTQEESKSPRLEQFVRSFFLPFLLRWHLVGRHNMICP